MLTDQVVQELNAIALAAKQDVIADSPNYRHIVDAAWNSIQNSLYSKIEQLTNSGYKTLDKYQIHRDFCKALWDQCAAMQPPPPPPMYPMQQQSVYSMPMPQVPPMPNYMGQGMSSISKPANSNPYMGAYSPPSRPVGATVMSTDVLNAANVASPTPPPLREPLDTINVTSSKSPDNEEVYTVDADVYDDDVLSDEEKLVKELMMMDEKDYCEASDMILANPDDNMQKVVVSESEDEFATMYQGEIKSQGFVSPESALMHVVDNIIPDNLDKTQYFIHVGYLKLSAIRASHSEGIRCFKALGTALADNSLTTRKKLAKIKEIIDESVKLAGDEIDALVTGMINQYTSKGYLEFGGDLHNVQFDGLTDVIKTLASSKPVKYTMIWDNKEVKERLVEVVEIVLNKLKGIKVYNFETVKDLPFVMKAVGAKLSEVDTPISSIEGKLLTRRQKDADKASLLEDPCYSEIKKYTVLGCMETAILTNCTFDIFDVDDDPSYVNIVPLEVSANDITTFFEYFLINHGINKIATSIADVSIRHQPHVTIKYKIYIDNGIVRFVM